MKSVISTCCLWMACCWFYGWVEERLVCDGTFRSFIFTRSLMTISTINDIVCSNVVNPWNTVLFIFIHGRFYIADFLSQVKHDAMLSRGHHEWQVPGAPRIQKFYQTVSITSMVFIRTKTWQQTKETHSSKWTLAKDISKQIHSCSFFITYTTNLAVHSTHRRSRNFSKSH